MSNNIKNNLLNSALWNNCYNVINNKKVSAFDSYIEKYQSVSDEDPTFNYWNCSKLSDFNYSLETSVRTYLADHGVTTVSYADHESTVDSKIVAIDSIENLRMSLGDAIMLRRSKRQFVKEKMGREILHSILQAANGITADVETELKCGEIANMQFRTVSSGGGLYPIEIYCYCQNVRNLQDGIYRFNPVKNRLIFVCNPPLSEICETTAIPKSFINISNANVVMFMVGNLFRSMKKYGPRGLRFILHETGAISQNVHLAVTSLGLGSVDCGSFYDEKVNNLLGIDGEFKTFVHGIILGNTN